MHNALKTIEHAFKKLLIKISYVFLTRIPLEELI